MALSLNFDLPVNRSKPIIPYDFPYGLYQRSGICKI